MEKLRQNAAGGCAMIILGDVPVGRRGFGPSLYTKKGFAHYQMLTETIHRENCRVCAQLHQSDSNWKAMVKYLPGVLRRKISMEQLRPLLNEAVGPYISGLSARGGPPHTDSFGTAAVLAKEAGFDMVQIHGGPHVRQFQLPGVQSPERCLRRKPSKSGPVCRGGGGGRARPSGGHAHRL